MGFYADRMLPWLIDRQLGRREIADLRRDLLADLTGDVLEVGFGTGLSLPHYPRSVTRLMVLDPHRPALKRVGERIAAAPFPVVLLPYPGHGPYPLPACAVDAVVSFFTLCTIPEVEGALREFKRVLRPGGRFVFLEHGASEEPRMLVWQQRLAPIQACIAGGCRLDRPIDALIAGTGFAEVRQERIRVDAMPRLIGRLFSGCATR
jgi:SAM-dependent methyltransferase